MRDLTEEELKLAPDWATHYIVDSDESIIYESEKLCWWPGRREPLNNEESFGISSNRSIKPLDINNPEFSDSDLSANIENGELSIGMELDSYLAYSKLNKSDAIAIAKALGVTGEDLK